MRRRSLAILADRLVHGLALTSALVVTAALAGCSAASAVSHGSDDQLRFGVEMARQGLWSEALFRFERAREMDPGNPRVLNNMAVALEAAGRYEDALEVYREALRVSPGNRTLSENYARFLEFYEGFKPEGGAEGVAQPAPAPAEPDGGEQQGEQEEPR